MRVLQRYSMVQHGVDISEILSARDLKISDIDVVYSPFFDALLCWPDVPQLITCHDLTPLAKPNSRKAWLRYRYWQPLHCKRASKLITISNYVADQLVEFGVPHNAIEIIPNGINVERPRVTSPQSNDLVILSRHDGNKNLVAFLKALAFVQKNLPSWHGKVKIIGRNGRQTAMIHRIHKQLPRPDQVELIPFLSVAKLLQLIRGSLALISASSEEGFDYPILEAKAEGIPTLISDIPVHREYHTDTSLFFPVDDNGDKIMQQLKILLNDSATWQALSVSGYQLAQKLSLNHQIESIKHQMNLVSNS